MSLTEDRRPNRRRSKLARLLDRGPRTNGDLVRLQRYAPADETPGCATEARHAS